jgi:cell division protein FtsW
MSMRNYRLQAGKPDFAILATVAALVVIGVIFVYSASFAIGLSAFHDPNYFIFRHLIAVVLGIGAMFLCMSFDYHNLRPLSPLIMLSALLSLGLVLAVGTSTYGARSWFDLGPLPFQPSEFAKLALIIYLSAWLASSRRDLTSLSTGFVPFMLAVGVVAFLIMMQPDTGTTAIIVAVTMTLFFLAGGSLIHVGALAGAAAVAGLLLIITEGYRIDRFLAFTSAESDPQGVGFQTLQLLIALGSGGWEGLGLGVSRQKFFYIPGAHTDGVFAIIGEEAGFVGAMVVVGLFAYLVYRGLRVAVRAHDDFGAYLAMGVVCWISFQALVNVGGITRSIPMTGIPLPLVSYGGSSLIMIMAGLGVLLNVSRYSRESPVERRPVRGKGAPTRRSKARPAMQPGVVQPAMTENLTEGRMT